MRNYITLIYTTLLILASCKEVGHKIDVDFKNAVSMDTLTYLKENLAVFGNIVSFEMGEKGGFVVVSSNPSTVCFYDNQGNQKSVLHAEGDGPFQFIQPSLVKFHNGKIYVWCENQLKLIIFSQEGIPLQEFRASRWAIRDFLPFEDKLILYTTGEGDESFIEIYDLSQERLIRKLGKATQEHVVLGMTACSGAMSIKDDILVYLSPDKLQVNRFDLKNLIELPDIKLSDDEFIVRNVPGKAVNFINDNREKAFEYINKNSVVNRLLTINNKIVICADVGEFEHDRSTNTFIISKRYNKYFILDKNYSLERIIKTPKTFSDNHCLMVSHKGEVYSLERIIGDQEEKYHLKSVGF